MRVSSYLLIIIILYYVISPCSYSVSHPLVHCEHLLLLGLSSPASVHRPANNLYSPTMSNVSQEEILTLANHIAKKHIESLEHEYEASKKKVLEQMMSSVSNSLQKVTASLVERQDAFENKTGDRMNFLMKQLSSLSDSLQLSSSNPSRAATARPSPKHRSPRITCNICKKVFGQLPELDKHIRDNHQELQCDLCGETFRSMPDLNVHHNRTHKSISSPDNYSFSLDNTDPKSSTLRCCNICDISFPCQSDLKLHKEKEHTSMSSVTLPTPSHQHNFPTLTSIASVVSQCIHCSFCAETFLSMRDLNIHTAVNHGDKLELTSTKADDNYSTDSRTCYLCGATFGNIENMKTHLANCHDAISFYSCTMCDRTFPNIQSFNEHLKSEHEIVGSVLCLICEKIFLNEKELQSHTNSTHMQRSHTIHETSIESANYSLTQDHDEFITQIDGNDSLDTIEELNPDPNLASCSHCTKEAEC